jgi:hypothetical protein
MKHNQIPKNIVHTSGATQYTLYSRMILKLHGLYLEPKEVVIIFSVQTSILYKIYSC